MVRDDDRRGRGFLHDSLVRKVWATGETNDISFRMLLLLVAGLALWIIYGLMRNDLVIIAANVASLTLLLCIIYFRLRERRVLARER